MKEYKQSIHSLSVANAIGSNNYKILNRPKYKNVISKTVVSMMKNGMCVIQWLDKDDCEVTFYIGPYNEEEYPIIGEKVVLDFEKN